MVPFLTKTLGSRLKATLAQWLTTSFNSHLIWKRDGCSQWIKNCLIFHMRELSWFPPRAVLPIIALIININYPWIIKDWMSSSLAMERLHKSEYAFVRLLETLPCPQEKCDILFMSWSCKVPPLPTTPKIIYIYYINFSYIYIYIYIYIYKINKSKINKYKLF